jgi:hypothetical protein
MKKTLPLLLALSSQAFAGNIPESLKGTWKVTRLETDPKNTSSYQTPVAKIKDAILTFSEAKVTLTDFDCTDPTVLLKKSADGEDVHVTCKNSKSTLPNKNDGLWFTENPQH